MKEMVDRKLVIAMREKVIVLLGNISDIKDLTKLSAKVLEFFNESREIIEGFNNDQCNEGLRALEIYASQGVVKSEKTPGAKRESINSALVRIIKGLKEIQYQ